MNPLKQLEACGQAPWLDYMKTSLISSGELRTMIERDGLKGITSNPSIFEKAIAESDEYTEPLKKFQNTGDHRHLRASGGQRHQGGSRCPETGLRGYQGPRRLYQPGMLAVSRQ